MPLHCDILYSFFPSIPTTPPTCSNYHFQSYQDHKCQNIVKLSMPRDTSHSLFPTPSKQISYDSSISNGQPHLASNFPSIVVPPSSVVPLTNMVPTSSVVIPSTSQPTIIPPINQSNGSKEHMVVDLLLLLKKIW